MTQVTPAIIKNSIATIADYPKAGIMFRDVTTLMANPEAFKATIDAFITEYLSLIHISEPTRPY